jgi:Na+-translocating ferredoxin:NAD+ oxidoreductase RnfC subunit
LKLKLQDYDVDAPFNPEEIEVKQVKILFQQHIGKMAEATVKKGEIVKEGQLVGGVSDNELGANIHASISGKVKEVTKEFILIES